MGKYQPIKIAGNATGLVQSREEFILPNDAYPVLQNAFVWRERIKRKKGCNLLGRLSRTFVSYIAGTTTTGSPSDTINLFTSKTIIEPNAQITPSSISITITGGNAANAGTATDNGDGTFSVTGNISNTGTTINYETGNLVITYVSNPIAASSNINISFSYFTNLPVCGILNREIDSQNNEQTIFFDTKYAYQFSSGSFIEYIPGTTWNGADYQLFWGTNYWVNSSNKKLFWVTNFNIDQATKDPIRYTDGITWTNFAPTINQAGNLFLNQALALLPFRGRLLAFNTYEGDTNDITTTTAIQYRQRIRWSALGSPIEADAWKDDVRGKGGFINIPTNQDIVSVGFVRDNLVIYCERSTWQLRYTGRTIAPFQIERVNAELGTESTFSAVQFDTSLVGFGDKAIVECDSFKSAPIDIKIPDLVFSIENQNNGNDRVVGIRDFQQRLAYWMYPITNDDYVKLGFVPKFPNRRLVYNYENDSWAIFNDSFTYFGSFQSTGARTWVQSSFSWSDSNFTWQTSPALFPFIVAGNQQGFILVLDQKVTNDSTLYISAISSGTGTITVITSPEHNLATSANIIPADGQVIQLINMTGDYAYLNNLIVGISRIDANTFSLYTFSSDTESFSIPVPFQAGTYNGTGTIIVRDGFSVQSKKFNFLDEGNTIQLGYIDVLMNNTESGAITMNVYADYNDTQPINTYPENANDVTDEPDTFFNSIIPTYVEIDRSSTKNWQRVYCATRASFLTTEFTLSNAQLNGIEQENDVQIDCQIMWVRKSGRQLPIGV